MRIGLIVPGYGHPTEPWAMPALRDLAAALSAGNDVEVLTLRHPSPAGTYRLDGIEVTSLGAGTAARWRRLPLLTRAVRAVAVAHRRRPYDVLHGLWADEPGAVAATAGRVLGIPAVVSVMGGELVALPSHGYGGALSRANRLLARPALRWSATVTAGSGPVRDLAARVARRPVRRWPLGVDTARFDHDGPAAPLAGDPPLLQVASLTRVKDHRTTLEALAHARGDLPGLRLHVVGAGPERAALEDAAVRLGVSELVRFHGHVAHDLLPAYYRGARLHLQSSAFESQGMAVLEAAASGLATVGTRVGILADLAPQRTVAPGAAVALGKAVCAALDDPARLDAEAAALRTQVRDRLGVARQAAALTAIYDDAVAARVTRTRPIRS